MLARAMEQTLVRKRRRVRPCTVQDGRGTLIVSHKRTHVITQQAHYDILDQPIDPNLIQLTEAEDRKRVHTGFVDKGPISIEDGGVLRKTVCKKCGALGHLAADCFSGGEKFDLLTDGDDDDGYGARSARTESTGKDKKSKDRERHKDKHSDKDKDKHRHKDRQKEKEGTRDRRERHESSSHRKEKRRDRSRR
jgi:hypothetical protein